MTFPTSSFTAVESPSDSTSDGSGNLDVTVTVPSNCKTLIAYLSSPSRLGITNATWDNSGTGGSPQAMTIHGGSQTGPSWGEAAIATLDNPRAGTFVLRMKTSGASGQGRDPAGHGLHEREPKIF